MYSVVSVDLASRRYRDNGIAVLTANQTSIEVKLIDTADLCLKGEPRAEDLATAIADLCRRFAAGLILIDGHQGWKSATTERVHQRHCEFHTRTPGKTGLRGMVKPASWTRMAVFSIELFDALARHGWHRLNSSWSGSQAAVESFPTQAWRSIGMSALPSKSKSPNVQAWVEHLRREFCVHFNRPPSHDELQATVAGIAGIQMLTEGLGKRMVFGSDPIFEAGAWCEGLIVCPVVAVGTAHKKHVVAI